MTNLTYTVAEVAEHLRLGRTTVYALIKSGDIPSIRIGGSRRVTAEALSSYLDALQNK